MCLVQLQGPQNLEHLEPELITVWEGGEGGLGKKSIQRMTLLHCQSMGKNFYRQREGVRAETIQSALTVFLKLVILKDGWSDHHLD